MNSLQPGTFLCGGKYRIVEVLGQGGFGITYLATMLSDGSKVAVKEFFLKKDNSRDVTGAVTDKTNGETTAYYRNRFKKEALHLAGLSHPGIVKYIETFDENDTCYYVMEFVQGVNLDEYTKDRVVSKEEAVAMIRETAVILQYMHGQRQLHLDLKPANIMRRHSDGKIILIDFGLSKTYTETGHAETSISNNAQTEGYAPMEMLNSGSTGDLLPSIDVYALGATLYKLLTRVKPPVATEVFNNPNGFVKNLILTGVPVSLQNFIMRAMAPRKGDRIQDMSQFIQELDAAMQVSNASEETRLVTPNNEETIIAEKQKQNNTQQMYQIPNIPDTNNYNDRNIKKKSSNLKWILGIVIVFVIIIMILSPSKSSTEIQNVSIEQPQQQASASPASIDFAKTPVNLHYTSLLNNDFASAFSCLVHNDGSAITQMEFNQYSANFNSNPLVGWQVMDIQPIASNAFKFFVQESYANGTILKSSFDVFQTSSGGWFINIDSRQQY